MGWFSKPRDSTPVAPARCARCGARAGTALVRFVAGQDAPPPDAGARTASLCDACQAEVRRRAGDN